MIYELRAKYHYILLIQFISINISNQIFYLNIKITMNCQSKQEDCFSFQKRVQLDTSGKWERIFFLPSFSDHCISHVTIRRETSSV